VRPLVIPLLFSAFASAQSELRNTITLSGGFAHNVADTCCGESAPSVGLSYAYRLFRHVDLSVGIDSAVSLNTEVRGATYDFKADDLYVWVPFGVSGVLPLHHDRFELSAGGGALWEKYYVASPASSVGLVSRDGWGGYGSAGAAVSLDSKRHFWLGTSPHFFFANTGNGKSHDRWFVLNFDLGFRF